MRLKELLYGLRMISLHYVVNIAMALAMIIVETRLHMDPSNY